MPRKASTSPRARPAPKSGALPWKRWALYAVLAAAGLFLGFLAPYAWYLDGQVQARFSELSWQIPTRVYARPLVVSPGLRMDADTLVLELQAAAYREDPEASVAGSYRREGGSFRIASRGYVDVDGRVPERRIDLRLADGRIASIQDAASGQALPAARLDPARIATLYGQRQEERRLARLEEMPEELIFALQAVEDRDFKHHRGVDLGGIARAFWANLREGEVVQGGSTLTQQLVRNLFLTREQTYWRKFNEALYSILIEARFDKARILEAYVNQVYLGQVGGQAVHGMVAGAEFWFGRDPQRLRSDEIAMLVGMIRGPSYYDPRRYPERARARRDLVLGVMAQTGVISETERDASRARPLSITSNPGVAANRYPAFMDLVRRQLADDYPSDALRGAGLSVMTTLSPSAQTYAERAVNTVLPSIETAQGPPLQTGMVVTDTHGGGVLAAIGNRRVDQPGFNRALEAQRPVGSLLKPFVYLLALVQPGRYSLASSIDDAPISLRLPNGQTWSPSNADNRSHGPVRLIDALAHSYNQATVRLGLDVGPEGLVVLLQRLAGVVAQPNPSLILGAVDASPFAMAQLYQFLASGGEVQTLKVVRGVLDADQVAINRYDDAPPPATEGDAIAARLVTLALQRAVTDGTARRLLGDGLGRLNPAGKTGTTNDGRDSWFAGWTGDHLAVVWVGNDENQAAGLYGATGAMRLWSSLFAELPSSPLDVGGEGIEWAWVAQGELSTTDEGCPGARRLPFVAGWAPRMHRGCGTDPIGDWWRSARRGGAASADGRP